MKTKPTLIKLKNCTNPTVKNNTGVGNIDLIDADNVNNLNANGNKLINPSNPSSTVKKWYEKPLGIVFLSVLTILIAGFLLYFFGWN